MAPSSELAVHHVGPTILGGVIFYPGDQAAQVVAGWREAIAHAPDELTSMINLTAAAVAVPARSGARQAGRRGDRVLRR